MSAPPAPRACRRARVVGLHALRNALIPVITVIGLQVGTLIAGAVLTETIFSWPGVGKWLIESIGRRDYPALQGGILLISSVVIVVNLTSTCSMASSTRGSAMAADVALPRRQAAPHRPARCATSGIRSARTAAPSSGSARRRIIVLVAILRRRARALLAARAVPRLHQLPPVWDDGGDWAFPARHRRGRAATSSRASSTARASRCSSACR